MKSRRRLIGAVVTVAAAAGLAFPMMANASPTDIAGAALTDAQDVAAAAESNAQQVLADPNTTCSIKAIGDNAVQRTDAVVAEVFAEDAIAAQGSCVSFDTSTYSATITVVDQAFQATSATGGFWFTVCTGPTVTAASIEGVAQPLPSDKLCTFGAPSSALNKYHRAVATLTNTRGQRFTDISPLWFVNS